MEAADSLGFLPAIALDQWVNDAVRWLVVHFRDLFQLLKQPIDLALGLFERVLRGSPPTVTIAVLAVVARLAAGRRALWLTLGGLFFIGLIGAWDAAMVTLAIVVTAVLLAVLVGLPLGVLAARSDRFWGLLRPCLDLMQTIPSFVYLVPVVLLLGLGNVPGVMITAFYAVPPLIRLTNLGLREVRADMQEAARAFGSTALQTLLKIELPLARPSIMLGINQTVMLSLAMSVIASMISVAGLGRLVLVGIGQLDMGRAATGGISIVLLAIILDRITQGLGMTRRQRRRPR